MKKNKKFLILLLALTMMCLCLTGCDDLDHLREQHANWVKEGDTSSLVLNGVVYKELENAGDLNPLYNTNFDGWVNVTNPDVPVLLSTRYSVTLNIGEDKNFITGYVYNNYEAEYENAGYLSSSVQFYPQSVSGKMKTYCKEDIYDEMMKKIEEGIEYTRYGYSYFTYNEDSYEDIYHYYYLSDEECEAINKVVKTVEPKQSSNEPYHEMYMLSLDKITEDKMFGEVSYDICRSELGDYSIEHYSYVTEEYTSYVVPEKYNDIFDKIVERAETQYDVYNEGIIYE